MNDATPHRIGGRYEVGGLLGRGGMAEVRQGTDIRLGRTVAIKRLRTDLASDQTFQARFRREAQSSASLNHPSIVAVYDTGEEWADGDGPDGNGVAQPYIVMEYVAGRTLRDIIREGRKILPERALEITAGVLSALDYSHRNGIIHRDIKPGNVILTPAGEVKVMDFGIARAVSDASNTMTQTAAVVGTAQYLSPEQARGETVDSRSDVYSTGCLLYELLTGRPPFQGDSPVAVAYQHVREEPQPPSTYDDELDEGIDAIVMKSLAKPLGERYQSAAAMRADIERYLAGKPVQAPGVAAAAAAGAAAGAAATSMLPRTPAEPATSVQPTSHAAEPDEEERKKKRGLLIAGVVALIALLTALAFFLPQILAEDTAQTEVPTVTGKNQTAAELSLETANLTLGTIDTSTSTTVARGLIISQSPEAGQQVEEGTGVDVVISTGPPDVDVPNVVGDQRDEAARTLRDLDLQVRQVERESDAPAGEVIEMSPGAGESVSVGTRITLIYSDGPETVPDVVGRTQEEAQAILEDAGFAVDVVEDPATEAEAGRVLSQSPDPGTERAQGDTITIVVSTFEPEPTPSPTPTPTDGTTPTDGATPTPTPAPSP